MTRWFSIAVAACIVGATQALFEDIERLYDEMMADPVKRQIYLFNEYAMQCFDEARKNQTRIHMQETESVCCLQDYWMECMKRVPLIKECSSLTENKLKKFEEDIVSGYDCSLVDLRTCVHKDGHENFVNGNKERSARFTSAAPPHHTPSLIALLAASMSLVMRLL